MSSIPPLPVIATTPWVYYSVIVALAINGLAFASFFKKAWDIFHKIDEFISNQGKIPILWRDYEERRLLLKREGEKVPYAKMREMTKVKDNEPRDN
jgi:hypothetical protein